VAGGFAVTDDETGEAELGAFGALQFVRSARSQIWAVRPCIFKVFYCTAAPEGVPGASRCVRSNP
jgi:hypothetical protein